MPRPKKQIVQLPEPEIVLATIKHADFIKRPKFNRDSAYDHILEMESLDQSFIDKQIGNSNSKKKDPFVSGAIKAQLSNEEYMSSYYNWNGILRPEYDMQEPLGVVDVETYVKHAVNRKLALILKNGWEIVSPNKDDVAYINNRISILEFVSNKTFLDFIYKTLWYLEICSNCFWIKVRNKKAATIGPNPDNKKDPVAGYIIMPPHLIYPYLEHGKLTKWRRYYEAGKYFDDYDLDDIIHFKWDQKANHIFGTPRLIGVRDDIFTLRRLEENIELLYINYLTPLYHIKVGTEKYPSSFADGRSEVEVVRHEFQNMPKEGVFITDERVSMDVIGANKQALEYMALVDHYKQRVFAGLSISGLDMGFAQNVTSQGSADAVSQILKDAVRLDAMQFAAQIKMYIFKEWFKESIDYVDNVFTALTNISFEFNEIDLDTKIKWENHLEQMYNGNLITFSEWRKQAKAPFDINEKDLHFYRETLKLAKETEKYKVDGQERLLQISASNSMPTATSPNGSRKGRPQRATPKKVSEKGKQVSNNSNPVNQHGTNINPALSKNSSIEEFITDFIELSKTSNKQNWKNTVDLKMQELENLLLKDQNSYNDEIERLDYTNYIKDYSSKLTNLIYQSQDTEDLYVILNNLVLNGEKH